ncbi:MAG: 4-hydroxy-3-methylbut-2-enyl diphosphate reductase [Desulfobacterales bacterium]|nr:4-hydroxy-3-methylbut-2-enyl diphosphate reductase [Desulfobacterales bacterium]
MKLFIAKTAGFCMGVRRAVDVALDAPGNHKTPIQTFGPLIHNPQVMSLLEEKGISIITEVPVKGSGTILIRAHGVPPKTKQDLIDVGFDVVDATCPRVIKVQNIIQRHARENYASIIIGDSDHPEVVGLLGYAEGNGYVANSIEALERLPAFDKAIVVAQTTQSTVFFNEVRNWISLKYPHYEIFNTICDSTEKRQSEVKQLAESVDVIIAVGGHNSGNTQRLAEIARLTGKQVYHVETESELDMAALASAKSIGITAGASTPNWIISKVYRALETLPFRNGKSWKKFIFAIQRYLLLTNLYVSVGAGCLSFACTRLMNIRDFVPYVIVSMLYVQSMHTLNHLTGNKEDRYNDPDRAAFYEKHIFFLTFLALASGGLGLVTALTIGMMPFLTLFTMSLLGLSYNLKILPKFLTGGRIRRIKDVPGSKTALIAIAWGIVTSIFPVLAVSGKISSGAILVFAWSTGVVFVRSAFFDMLDMQGDRIVGKETIPLLLGEKRARRVLKGILVIISIVLFVSSAIGLLPSLGFFLVLCPLLMLLMLTSYERVYLLPGVRLEFLVETNFIISGAIAFLWSLF